jgi:hypothetical protein
METRNFTIASKANKVLRFNLCSSNTNTFTCTSFPVFAEGTNDGTTRYSIDTPLKQLSPAGSFRSANNPAVSYNSGSGTGTITFTYGSSFAADKLEYEASSQPRRYRYFLHVNSYNPGTAYSAAITASSLVILGGTVSMVAPAATASTVVTVCSVEVS